MNTRRSAWLLLVIVLAWGCTPRPAPTAVPTDTAVPAPVVPTAAIPQPTATLIPPPSAPPPLAPLPSVCTPEVTATTAINVRSGPGTIYSIVGSLVQGKTATVEGKNTEGTWWYILYPSAAGGHGWVAGSVTTSNCITASLPVIPVSSYPVPFVAAVTNVEVSVDPSEITVPGCVGETERMTAYATIYASGPMDVEYSFEIDGVGTLKTKILSFSEYGSQVVSERFHPDPDEGVHWVRLWIEGLNMRSWQYQAQYRINC